MPELPEVETIVRELIASHLIGKKIVAVTLLEPKTVGNVSPAHFCKELVNQTILDVQRRGKFIIIKLEQHFLLIHLRMTGKLQFKNESLHERLRMQLDDGRYLHYYDQRKFGRWYLVKELNERLSKLGIEPLSTEFTESALHAFIRTSKQMIKPFLLNQSIIVGLGNIYVDEALWEAKIHPARKAQTLTSVEVKRLHKAIQNVLQQGILQRGTTLGSTPSNYSSVSGRRGSNQNHLKVFRKEGLKCPRCNTLLIKIRIAQRGTHLCPECQKLT